MVTLRNAEPFEADALAELWYSGWQDAHARILSAELARHRTLGSFRRRMGEHLGDVRVAGELGMPLGFSMLKDDELYQFYVAAAARGSGLAAVLLADAENALRSRGLRKAWLACAIGNDRAAKFYAKGGWTRTRNMINELPLPDGSIYKLEVWRYEKDLAGR
jgi:GNAT superfamily N-acetyltransferase